MVHSSHYQRIQDASAARCTEVITEAIIEADAQQVFDRVFFFSMSLLNRYSLIILFIY